MAHTQRGGGGGIIYRVALRDKYSRGLSHNQLMGGYSDRLKKRGLRYVRSGSTKRAGGGGFLGTSRDKKRGLYRGAYLYWTYMYM